MRLACSLPFPKEPDTEDGTDRDMGRTDWEALRRGDQHRNRRRERYAVGPHRVHFRYLIADHSNEAGAKQGQPDGNTDRTDTHDPEGYGDLRCDLTRCGGRDDGGQRANGIRDIVRSVRERKQCGETDERYGEQGSNRFVSVLHAGHPAVDIRF